MISATVRWSLTSAFTVMRQPITSLSPCATTLTLTAGAVVVTLYEPRQGGAVNSLRSGVHVKVVDIGHGSRRAEA